MKAVWKHAVLLAVVLGTAWAWAGDAIPKAAWKTAHRPAPENAGTRKPALTGMIDDGYWQGAPVGGFGAGTFFENLSGDFARWRSRPASTMSDGMGQSVCHVSEVRGCCGGRCPSADGGASPEGTQLSTWKWDYPAGAGDYYSLYPKCLVRLPLGQVSGARDAGAVLSYLAPELPREQLSGSGVPVARTDQQSYLNSEGYQLRCKSSANYSGFERNDRDGFKKHMAD